MGIIYVFLAIVKVLILIILVVLTLALTMLLGLLLIPFKIKGDLRKNQAYEAEIGMQWLRGIMKSELVLLPEKKLISIKLFNLNALTREIKPTPKKIAKEPIKKKISPRKQPEEETREKGSAFSVSELVGQIKNTADKLSMETLQEIMRFLIGLFSSLQIRFSGKAEVGLGDPADTGMLLGFFYAVTGALNIDNFSLQPNWDEPAFSGQLRFSARVWLIQILYLAVRTMLAKSIRVFWWPYAKQFINLFSKTRPQTA